MEKIRPINLAQYLNPRTGYRHPTESPDFGLGKSRPEKHRAKYRRHERKAKRPGSREES